jgi:hypothetical protein
VLHTPHLLLPPYNIILSINTVSDYIAVSCNRHALSTLHCGTLQPLHKLSSYTDVIQDPGSSSQVDRVSSQAAVGAIPVLIKTIL